MTSEKKVPGDQDRARGRSTAERRKRTSSLATAGGLANVGVIAAYQSGLFNADDLDILECRDEVVKRVRQVQEGNTAHVVGLLMAQALALNGVFTKLAIRAAQVDDQDPRRLDTYLRLALKAQSQSRATLEAVLAAGNPPVLFAHQANVAFGPQQVNNSVAATAPRTSEMQTEPNKLLEDSTHERTQMDNRATPAASREDPSLAPVAAIHRPAHRRR